MNLFPNPTHARTFVKFRLHEPAEVEITLLDRRGTPLRTLLQGHQKPGHHQLIWNQTSLKKGNYFVLIRSPHRQLVRKIVVH